MTWFVPLVVEQFIIHVAPSKYKVCDIRLSITSYQTDYWALLKFGNLQSFFVRRCPNNKRRPKTCLSNTYDKLCNVTILIAMFSYKICRSGLKHCWIKYQDIATLQQRFYITLKPPLLQQWGLRYLHKVSFKWLANLK